MEIAGQRRWQRLPIPIPVFARGTDVRGGGFLEFTTLLNISGGGALLVLRCPVTTNSPLNLEIPVPPMPSGASPKGTMKKIKARIAHAVPKEGYQLLGLQFSRPLLVPLANL